MSKKRVVLLSGALLTEMLLVGLVGVTAVSAQEPMPQQTADEADIDRASGRSSHRPARSWPGARHLRMVRWW